MGRTWSMCLTRRHPRRWCRLLCLIGVGPVTTKKAQPVATQVASDGPDLPRKFTSTRLDGRIVLKLLKLS